VKTALIALTILLIGSLGTSGYLLMQQKMSKGLIDDAQKVADAQKKKSNEAKNAADKEKGELLSKLGVASNSLAKVKIDIAKERGDATSNQADLAERDREITGLKSEQVKLESEIQKRSDQLTQTMADHNASRAKLENKLEATESLQKEKTAELGKAVEALKPFLAIGLTPEEITELRRAKPVEIAAPRFVVPKPLVPGKIRTPIQPPINTP